MSAFKTLALPERLQPGYVKEFKIYRCGTPSGNCAPNTLIATMDDPAVVNDPNRWTFTDTDVTPGMVYCYRATFRHQNACYPASGPEFWESPYSSTQCSTTCCPPSNGPFWTDYGGTAQELAEWIMAGSGITVVPGSATYTGAAVAKGTFGNGSAANFPISTGVIFSSGDIALAKGPNDKSDATKQNIGTGGDTSLNNLLGSPVTSDAAVLEFYISSPVATNLVIEYIFASEEYPEYVDTGFNDIMAIFVDGANIAHVPVAGLPPVGVNYVNGGYLQGNMAATNPQYYVDNHDPNPVLYSAQPPYAAPAPVYNLQYDGTTVLLTAQTSISANVSHYVKIAIADASDRKFDSVVFLKAQIPCP